MDPNIEVAEKVRTICVQTFKEHFHEALLSGLCNDGALEVAIGAVEAIDLEKVLGEVE